MFRTLQSKLIFFFLMVSLGSIILISIVIQYSFYGSFQDYLEAKRLEQIDQVIENIEQEYRDTGKVTGDKLMSILHHHVMMDQLYFTFYDSKGSPIFDSTRHLMMFNRLGESSNELQNRQFSITVEEKQIGLLSVYYAKEFLNIDSQFLKQFNRYIIFAALIMILISVVVSILLSKKFTYGLRQVSKAARELQKNNLDVRIPERQHVDEINQLAQSFNELASSLKNQEKLRKQFTNDLAHELRTPLATLRSQNEAFLDGVWEPSEERLKQSHEEIMRLVRLVDDLEKLLAAENPQIQLQISEINTKEVMKKLLNTFQPQFQQKGVALLIEEPTHNFNFEADRDRFFQIMSNLLNNSLKYTDEGGKVVLKTEVEKQSIHFIIEDNGLGISEEDLPFIYERFYRGEKSRNRKTGGVGIGLSIVKALVEAHKGIITIKSKQNSGTKVKVTFYKTI